MLNPHCLLCLVLNDDLVLLLQGWDVVKKPMICGSSLGWDGRFYNLQGKYDQKVQRSYNWAPINQHPLQPAEKELRLPTLPWTLSKLSSMLHLAHLLCVNFWHLYFSLSKKVITRQSQHVIIVALPALLTVNRVHRTLHNVSKLRKPSSEDFQSNWKEKVLIQNQYISRPRADKVNMTSINNCVTSWLCNKLPISDICSNANQVPPPPSKLAFIKRRCQHLDNARSSNMFLSMVHIVDHRFSGEFSDYVVLIW